MMLLLLLLLFVMLLLDVGAVLLYHSLLHLLLFDASATPGTQQYKMVKRCDQQ
jgi:hypothetical protein